MLLFRSNLDRYVALCTFILLTALIWSHAFVIASELGDTDESACFVTAYVLDSQLTSSGVQPPVICPSWCTNATGVNRLSSTAVLFGSYPYHVNSSICLAAIHSGIITNELGGGVFWEKFYRLTGATQAHKPSSHTTHHSVRSVTVSPVVVCLSLGTLCQLVR
jgi:hypothetical protein